MKYLTQEEERKLLNGLNDSKSAVRDHAIISLILNTGLRCRECRLLLVSDVWDGVTRQALTVRKDTAKRSRERTVPLHAGIQKHLGEFIRWKKRQGEDLTPSAPLFVSRKGNLLSQRATQRIVEKWIEKTGLEGYTTHSLRHSFAMKLRRKDTRLEVIQRLLGHSSLASTGIYVQPSKEDLAKAVDEIAA